MTVDLTAEVIRDRLHEVERHIRAVAERPVDVVVVTKTHSGEVIRRVVEAGAVAIGENYAQELRNKSADIEFARECGVRTHFIGQLQTNKVRLLTGLVDCIASVDRESLIDEISKRIPGCEVHLQVNTNAEAGKGGCSPRSVPTLIRRANEGGLNVTGLMTVGPTNGSDAETARAFRHVRELADEHNLRVRNFGMSGDLEIAVASGSTMVRIGTAILGNRR